ncbi:MAG: protein adenylyltransferase SelO family protein, partial [Campylobacterota bacterium]|nr:protein adenylyltransferase SelO family protein [Campylobacterota bacterium]
TPIISQERMQQKLDDYGAFIFPNAYIEVMREKLGLFEELQSDAELIEDLIVTLHEVYVDHTLFFRTLSRYDGDRSVIYDIVMEPVIIDKWLEVYDARLQQETLSHTKRHEAMLKSNPKYVLKNHMLQKAITLAQKGDYSMVETLLYVGAHPYDELPEFERFTGDTPEEYKNIGLACSS